MTRLKNVMMVVCCALCLAGPAFSAPRNVVLIVADDQSQTLGCYGDAYAITPNIDRLAKQSVRYTKAFAAAPVSASILCACRSRRSSARCSLTSEAINMT